MSETPAEAIRQRLASSVQHLTRVCNGNDEFIRACESEIDRATSTAERLTHTDPTRSAMVADMAAGMRSLVAGVRAVDEKLRQKLVVCEALYSRLAESSHVIEADSRTAAELLLSIPPGDRSFIPLIAELVAEGHVGCMLDGLVLPFLRQSEIPAFRELCE